MISPHSNTTLLTAEDVAMTDTISLSGRLAAEFTRAAPDPTLTRQRLSVALYRLLAEGEPVAAEGLAESARVPVEEAIEALERWPNVFLDSDGRVIAFGGLALRRTPHRFEIDGRTLHAWCAWDTLFLPIVLGRAARVESRSPTSGTPIALTVTPDGVENVSPQTTVLSLVHPGEFGRNLIKEFCHHVHFLASPEDGERWLAEHERGYVVSLADGFELGRVWVEHNYGAALEETADAR
jgi:alkylmercury lyase